MKRFLFIPLFVFVSLSFAACDDTVEVCVIDGYCDIDETWAGCPEDCPVECIDDGFCDPDWEDSLCADCAVDTYCGDGYCDADETETNCPEDCAVTGCNFDGVCEPEAGETYVNCADDCELICNDDGVCEPEWGEDETTCPNDCVASFCGDGTCDMDETYADCEDCASDCVLDADCDPDWEDLYTCAGDCTPKVCEDWAIYIEDYGCEDDVDTCVVDTVTCEDNMDFIAANDPAADVDLVEICAAELALNSTCDEVLVDGVNCADLLVGTGYGEMMCQ